MEKKIGHGQFSVVYRAKNVVDGEVVALKKIQVLATLTVPDTSKRYLDIFNRFLTW